MFCFSIDAFFGSNYRRMSFLTGLQQVTEIERWAFEPRELYWKEELYQVLHGHRRLNDDVCLLQWNNFSESLGNSVRKFDEFLGVLGMLGLAVDHYVDWSCALWIVWFVDGYLNFKVWKHSKELLLNEEKLEAFLWIFGEWVDDGVSLAKFSWMVEVENKVTMNIRGDCYLQRRRFDWRIRC